MPTKQPTPPPPPPAPVNLLKEIARKHGRDYITPEDVGEAMASHPAARVQWHLLAAFGGRHDVGCEDARLMAFIATVRGEEPNPPAPTDTAAPPLTDDQRLELAACYAEWCGVDPEDRQDWRTEMVVAKKWVSQLMTIWARRSKKATKQNPPTSPPPPRKKS